MESIRAQAITFDVGGTLITPYPSVGQIYADIAADHGHPKLPVEKLNRQFVAAWRNKGEFQYTEAGWLEIVSRSFDGLLEQAECQSFFPALYQRFTDAEVWRIHDDAREALDELAGRGFRLALVSNWDVRLRPLLQNLKLTTYFETITVSSEIGFTKPSPVPFEHTLKHLGLPASDVVHVGDSAVEDIDGAESAGITGILLRRSEGKRLGSISDLRELGQLLQEAW